MNTDNGGTYKPSLKERTRVQLARDGHRAHSHCGVILRVLPNPSKRGRNQWYDVRFDSGILGRFLERYLEVTPAATDEGKKIEGSQTLVA
jgi:hypothetical protein